MNEALIVLAVIVAVTCAAIGGLSVVCAIWSAGRALRRMRENNER
jgi:hypothetical protein